MPHPYTPYCPTFPYRGRYRYLLTFVTFDRTKAFAMVVEGLADDADLKAFVKLAKQYSGYYHARAHGRERLWQKGFNDHIVRDDVDLLDRVRYVVDNPVAASLVTRPQDYPFLGSQRWSMEKLIAWCRLRIGNARSSDDGY